MGSYEIFVRNCEANTRNIAELRTPSPLTSSISSDNSSSSSLLTDIDELTLEELIYRIRNHKNVYFSEETKAKDLPEDIESQWTSKTLQNDRTSNKTSYHNSSSLLKLNLRDSSSEVQKLANHIISLDRKIRAEEEVYVKLENGRAEKITKMCSSAPETMRLEKQTYEQRLHDFTKDLKKPVSRNFEEHRTPKYLQPLRTQSRDIFRSNDPPLCLTDKKIVELLRRGSVSARDENLKKSSSVPLKVSSLRQPTGMIIQSLSSGSEDDNSTSDWIIRSSSGSKVTKFVNKIKVDDNSRMKIDSDENSAFSEEIQINGSKKTRENDVFDSFRSTRSIKSIQRSLSARTTELIDEIEASDHLQSSRSVKSIQKSLQSSMAELKSVLNSIDLKSRESRQLVPKLDIQSQDYSQSTSLPSREDSTIRSLDMNALIRALSDVSLKQKQLLEPKMIASDINEESTEPTFSENISVANGSRQSIVSLENLEEKQKNSCYSLPQNSSQSSSRTVTKCQEKNSNRSKIPIVVSDTIDKMIPKINDVEMRKNMVKKIVENDYEKPEQEFQSKNISNNTSATRNNFNCQTVDSTTSKNYFTKTIKLYSPPMKRNRELKSPKISKTDASSSRGKISRLPKSLRSSEFENSEKNVKKNDKASNTVSRVSSEPSRNGQKILQNNVSSRMTSSAREILPGILKVQPRSSDEKFKYLRRGSQIPCVSSSTSSFSSEEEESELQQTVIKSLANDCQSSDDINSKGKFKIYEDTDEASPRPQVSFPIEKLNTTAVDISASKTCRANVLSVRKNSEINSSPEDSINNKVSNKSSNFFWAESSSEMNQAISSSFSSNQAIESVAHSSVNSPRTVVKLKKSSTSSCRSSSRISSKKSPNATGSSDSPRYRYYDENARITSRNLVGGASEHYISDAQHKNEEENLFSATAIAKRLSYSEMKEEAIENEISTERSFQESPENSPAEESIENSSKTNLTNTGKSDGAVQLFRKTFDRTASRVSSSLSKLSPHELKKESLIVAARRRSQDRFGMTISDSDSGKFSSRAEIVSGGKIIQPTTYRLTAHPSILRLASGGIEPTTMEIIASASHNKFSDFPNRRTPKIRRFLGFSWRRSGKEKKTGNIESTRILYRNNQCRGRSLDGSCESMRDKSTEQFNRNGLWVEGLKGEVNVEEDKMKNNQLLKQSEKAQQKNDDRFSIFIAKTKSPNARELNKQTKISINSMMLEEEPEIDPGCLCTRFCLFLIGGNVHHRHRSTFAIRNRRSRIRRTF